MGWKERRELFIKTSMAFPFHRTYDDAAREWMILCEDVPEGRAVGLMAALVSN